jgi:putative phosphoribosyl transferase
MALHGDLCIPDQPGGIVLFAHGSCGGRYSSRNRMVARDLQHRGLVTLLLDLLTPGEQLADAEHGGLHVDIQRLAERLAHATDWLRHDSLTAGLPVGYFGAGTGAAAALVAAAIRPHVRAIVARGGRPDLAERALGHAPPTLLIVGSADVGVLELSLRAQAHMNGMASIVTVAGAHHRFEEPGALECVVQLAGDWFKRHLVAQSTSPAHHGADGQ